MVGADAGGDGDLELLRFGETLSGQVAGVEAVDLSILMACLIRRTHGVVMMTSASTSSWSNLEVSPSLSDVVTKVWPWSSSHFRIPSSFSVVPSISGTSRACSRPSYRTRRTCGGQDQKYAFGRAGGSDGITLPCCGAVAVSVRTPPKRWNFDVTAGVRAVESREEAGRDNLETERRNTILKKKEKKDDYEISTGALNCFAKRSSCGYRR